VFLLFYIYIYVFVFAFQIELIVQKDDQFNDFGNYINCLYLALFNKTLHCQLHQYVNYPLWVIVVFNASAQGIFVWFIFGTTLQVYKAWLRLFRLDRVFSFLRTSGSTSSASGTRKIHGTKVLSGASTKSASMMQSLDTESEEDDEKNTAEEGDKKDDDDNGGDEEEEESSSDDEEQAGKEDTGSEPDGSDKEEESSGSDKADNTDSDKPKKKRGKERQ